MNSSKQKKLMLRPNIKWGLVFYDVLIYAFVCYLMLVKHPSTEVIFSTPIIFQQAVLGAGCVFLMRLVFDVYRQIWRYGSMPAYMRLLAADACGGILYVIANYTLPIGGTEFIRQLSIVCLNLLGAIAIRMVYHWLYDHANRNPQNNTIDRTLLKIFGKIEIQPESEESLITDRQKIKIAIVGAGRVGVALADDLLTNPKAVYTPVCFIDVSKDKIGRSIMDIPVLDEKNITRAILSSMGVQEIVFAVPQLDAVSMKALYSYYKATGCRIKVYDYPTMENVGKGKRAMREFSVEELLFRPVVNFASEKTASYFMGKTILVTGGGGSIGSELCRQLAKMDPKKIIILDIYENGAYDLQQELKIKYGAGIDLQIEICSVADRRGFEEVFKTYHPDILIHAAAHKHVPLMEHNCAEAVKNNVFGTLNAVELAEKYAVSRFMLVSTDKAVNPTNVMGATKRMCELIALAHNGHGSTVYTATRFGNVLGSAGSVIPLFKRQIANGGPITITDKRIIRYFMTIPEASQLILESGASAKEGELFVLDMGKPVKILDLAENMVRLSGLEPYRDIQIIETGLRPGEKLYEELLIQTEDLTRTDNDLIFVEKDESISLELLEQKLSVLREAVETENSQSVRKALKQVVETYKSPEEVNAAAEKSREMEAVYDNQGVKIYKK